MKVFQHAASAMNPADANSFVGPAMSKLLASHDEGTPVHVYRVEFGAGGRTNWHRHSGAQWLLIIEGRIRVQCWGEPPRDVVAGDAVVFEPGEKHWHGARSGTTGAHIAVNLNVKTEWLEPVSDGDYAADPSS